MSPRHFPKSDHKSARNRLIGALEASSGAQTQGFAVPQSAKHARKRRNAREKIKNTTQMNESTSEFSQAPPSPHLRDKARIHMFGDNVTVLGGSFTQAENVIPVVGDRQTDPFKLLQLRVAASAFHDSAQRFDPPRCHPNTRVAIPQEIYDWIVTSGHQEQWLLWLNGAAGAGKSAIMQFIVERCIEAGIALASFFFFRADPTRNTILPLIATLAYQLCLALPETSADICDAIRRNPLIFDQSIESQMNELLVQPLLRLPNNPQRLFAVFIDGLDECNDRTHQSSLIRILGSITHSSPIRIAFIVASRREPQIEAAFIQRPITQILRTIPLDNSDIEQTSDDIRRFLVDKFDDIKESHLYRHYLPSDWPPPAAIEEIVAKSSGQFIYASVVVNYISSPHGHPALQLEIINGLRPRSSSSQNPFAHLDALYSYIFSQVKEIDIVRNILAFTLATNTSRVGQDVMYLRPIFQLAVGELEVYFSDLAAVIEIDRGLYGGGNKLAKMKFLHASLPDFLTDRSRSGEHYIDIDENRTKLLCLFLQRVPSADPDARISALIGNQELHRLMAISQLISCAKPSDQLRNAFMNFRFILCHDGTYGSTAINTSYTAHWDNIDSSLGQINFKDQGAARLHFSNEIAKEYAKVDQGLLPSHLRNRIAQILEDEM